MHLVLQFAAVLAEKKGHRESAEEAAVDDRKAEHDVDDGKGADDAGPSNAEVWITF